MKNARLLFLTAVLALSLTACGGSPSTTPEEDDAPERTSTDMNAPSEKTTSDDNMSTPAGSSSGSTSRSSSTTSGSSGTSRSSSTTSGSSGTSRSSSTSKSSDDYTFEEYLKDNDPDAYESYKDLEKGWNSGSWDAETGFFDN